VLMYEELDENCPNCRIFPHIKSCLTAQLVSIAYRFKKKGHGDETRDLPKPMNNETHATYSDQAFASVMGNVYIVTGKLSS
jgi:hypothetical protein